MTRYEKVVMNLRKLWRRRGASQAEFDRIVGLLKAHAACMSNGLVRNRMAKIKKALG